MSLLPQWKLRTSSYLDLSWWEQILASTGHADTVSVRDGFPSYSENFLLCDLQLRIHIFKKMFNLTLFTGLRIKLSSASWGAQLYIRYFPFIRPLFKSTFLWGKCKASVLPILTFSGFSSWGEGEEGKECLQNILTSRLPTVYAAAHVLDL